MPINFPNSPTNGQTFVSGGREWVYTTGKGWTAAGSSAPTGPQGATGPQGPQGAPGGGGGGASVTTSDTAPSSPLDGDLWLNTANMQLYIYYDDGDTSQWVSVVGPNGPSTSLGINNAETAFTPPTTSNFGTTRLAKASISNLSSSRGIRIQGNGYSVAGDDLQYAMASISSGAGGWDAIARIRRHSPYTQFGAYGIAILDNSGGKLQTISSVAGSGAGVTYERVNWTNATTYSSTPFTWQDYSMNFWLRVREASGTRKWYTSQDGDFWMEVYSETISGNFLASPTHVGIFWNAAVNTGGKFLNVPHAIDCLSWKQNAL